MVCDILLSHSWILVYWGIVYWHVSANTIYSMPLVVLEQGKSMEKDNTIQWNHSHDFGIDVKHKQNKVKFVFWLTTVVMVLEILVRINGTSC